MNDLKNRTNNHSATYRDVILRSIELLCLMPAYGFAIPPVSSTEEEYRISQAIVYGTFFMTCSLLLARRRRAENWFAIIYKILLYIMFVYAINLRVQF